MRHTPYLLYHCSVCDLMFWFPLQSPGPDWYRAQFFAEALEGRPPIIVSTTHKKFFRDMPVRGGRLLDVGCGAGDFLALAQEAGYKVTGIDFVPALVESARSRFQLNDAYPLTIEEFIAERPDDRFDVVTFNQVLEHLDAPSAFLEKVKQVLKPGGYIVCGVPNRRRWRWFNKAILDSWELPPHHFTLWTEESLLKLFAYHNFQIVTLEHGPLLDYAWGFWVYSKSGFQPLIKALGIRLLRLAGVGANGVSRDQTTSSGAASLRRRLLKLTFYLYLQFLPLVLGLATFPLAIMLRREGTELYLLGKLNEGS